MAIPSSSSSSSSTPVHLVVLLHGLWGEPKHLHSLEALLERSFDGRATVVRPPADPEADESDLASEASTPDSSPASKLRGKKGRGKKGKSADAEVTGNPKPAFSDAQEVLLERNAPRKRDAAQGDRTDVVILNTSTNRSALTYDGIDWLAERAVREILHEQTTLEEQGKYVARFSMIGYSLGGLVARCALGLLEHQGFFDGDRIQPRQLITIATPHVGMAPGSGWFSHLAAYIGARLLSRTGEQIYCADGGWDGVEGASSSSRKVGLLEHMSQPESIFMRALNRFEKVHFYANAVNDMTVPFRSGCIELYDPFIEQADAVEVQMLADAPILTQARFGEPPKRSFGQRVKARFTSWPPFLNPRRLPLSFPYNYIVVIASPILLPVFLSLVIVRFWKESRKSRARIAEMEHGWRLEQAEAASEGRVMRLIKSTMRSAGEDNVGADRDLFPSLSRTDERVAAAAPHVDQSSTDTKGSSTTAKAPTEQASTGAAPAPSASSPQPWHTPWSQKQKTVPKSAKLTALPAAQHAIVCNLNNPAVLPRMKKVWTYYPDLTNAHAVIIARTLTIEPHKRGLPVLKHLVDDFLP